MKILFALLLVATVLVGCGSGEAEKQAAPINAKEYKPETGKLSDLRPGGVGAKKGAGTSSVQ